MNLEDLLRDSEKDLSPLFSEAMVSVIFGSLWIMAVLLFLSWPHSSLSRHLQDFHLPWTFFCTFAGALIITAYVNMRCGLGEILPKVVSARMDREGLTTFDEEKDYFSYAFPQTFWQTMFLILLLFPFLVLGAMIHGTTLSDFLVALEILFSASFLCRQAGFFFLLLWGRWRFGGYWSGRLFYLAWFFGTAFSFPALNPLLLLFHLHFGQRVPLGPEVSSPLPYFFLVVFLFLFFTIFCWRLIRRKNLVRRRP